MPTETQSKPPQPMLIVYVTSNGVAKVKVPFRSLAEKEAGRQLEARCSTILQLLSQVAKGAAIPTPTLPAASVTHASNQTHHPRS
jgi:hypothetical protein